MICNATEPQPRPCAHSWRQVSGCSSTAKPFKKNKEGKWVGKSQTFSYFCVCVRSTRLSFHCSVKYQVHWRSNWLLWLKRSKNSLRKITVWNLFSLQHVSNTTLKLWLRPPNYLGNYGMSNWHRADGSDVCRGSSAAHLGEEESV